MTGEISKDYGTQYAETVLYNRETTINVIVDGQIERVRIEAVPADAEIPEKYRERGATDAKEFWEAFARKVRESE